MAIDRGGLAYTINISGNFAEQIAAFKAELTAARESWAAFRAEVGALGGASSRAKTSVQGLGDAAEAQASAASNATRATKGLLSAEQVLIEAEKSLIRETNRLLVTREKELTVIQEQATAQEQTVTTLRGQAGAAKDLANILALKVKQQEKANLAEQQGIELNARQTQLLNIRAAAERQIAIEAENRAIAQERLNILGQQEFQGPAFGPDARRTAGAEQQLAADIENLKRTNLLKTLRANSAEYQALTQKINDTKTATKQLSAQFVDTESKANRIAFTFRRLIGIMAAFTIARQVVTQFKNIIVEGIRFDASLQDIQLGIAGLITSTGTIHDALGNVVTGEKAFIAAQAIASDQLQKLQSDAQLTSASFKELATEFQTGVAAGLAVGSLDDLRKFTRDISTAASLLHVSQTSLFTEINQILSGRLTVRTPITNRLGISPDDIKRAIRLGTLMEFLQERMSGIARAGRALMQTFNTQLSNLVDGFQRLLGAANTGFFTTLSGLFDDVLNRIQTQIGDTVKVNPAAVQVLKGLFDGLQSAVAGIKGTFQSIDFKELVPIFSLVGEFIGALVQTFSLLSRLLLSFSGPALISISQIFRLLNAILSILIKITSEQGTWFTFLVRTGFQLLVSFKILQRFLIVTKAVAIAFETAAIFVLRIKKASIETELALGLLTVRGRVFANTMRSAFLPMFSILAIALALDKLSKGRLTNVFDKVGTLLRPVFQELDQLTSSLLGLPTTIEQGMKGASDVAISNLDKIKSELDGISDEMRKSLRGLQADLGTTLFTLGASPEVSNEIKTALNTIRDSEEKIFDIKQKQAAVDTQAISLAQKLRQAHSTNLATQAASLGLADKRSEAERALVLLYDTQSRLLGKVDTALVNNLATQEEINGLAQSDILSGGEDPRLVAAVVAQRALLTLNNQILVAKNKITSIESLQLSFTEATKASAKEEEKAIQGINISQQQSTELNAELLKVRKENLAIALRQLQISAIERNFTLENATALTEASAASLKAQNVAFANRDPQEVERLQAKLAVEQAEIQLKQQSLELKRNEVLLETSLSFIKKNAPEEVGAIAALERQIGLERLNNNALIAEGTAKIQAQREALARLELLKSGGIGEGFKAGLLDFANQNSSIAQVGINLGQSFASGLTSFIGDSAGQAFAAAIDPNKNFDLRAATLAFAEQLVSQFVSQLVAVGISQLLLSIIPAAAPAAGAAELAASAALLETASATLLGGSLELLASGSVVDTAAIGLLTAAAVWGPIATTLLAAAVALSAFAGGGAEGGKVVGPMVIGSGHFIKPQGFSLGGRSRSAGARPRGLDPRDQIPVWARPGEWMIRPESVSKYGDFAMAMINAGRIDPEALRSLAKASRRPSSASSAGPGFAAGGIVRHESVASIVESRRGDSVVLIQPITFDSEQTMDQALAAGPKSLSRFHRTHRHETRAALGLGRGDA